MLSSRRSPTAENALLLLLLSVSSLLLLPLLSSPGVHGASLREHRLRGSEPDLPPPRGTPLQTPNADMLKALEYIENLHQRTDASPRRETPSTPEYNAADFLDDTKKLRGMLRSAATVQGQAGQSERGETERQAEEEEEKGENQEWMQAVLRTLQETDTASNPPLTLPDTAQLSVGDGRRPLRDDQDAAYPWDQVQRGTKPHKKYPPMFEDEEDNSRVDEGDPVDEEEEDERDMFDVRNPLYEDGAGGLEDWGPRAEQEEDEEEEEEERGNKHEADRSLYFGDDEEDGYDDEDEGDDEENYPVKRATQSDQGHRDEPDELANLVDYYLLRVLEKTEEEEERKRALEEEKRRAERRAAHTRDGDNIDPQAIYQLIQISQRLQIPPEDLMDLLKAGESTQQARPAPRSQTQSRQSHELARLEEKASHISSNGRHKNPAERSYSRRLPDRRSGNTPQDITKEDLINILGLADVGNRDSASPKKQKQRKTPGLPLDTQFGRQGNYARSQKPQDDYDDTDNEDELAEYLAAQILARYPDTVYDKVGQKRASGPSLADEGEQTVLGQAVQDYFDQVDSEKDPHPKRRSQSDDDVDEEALLKIMSYLNPEPEEREDSDADDKTEK